MFLKKKRKCNYREYLLLYMELYFRETIYLMLSSCMWNFWATIIVTIKCKLRFIKLSSRHLYKLYNDILLSVVSIQTHSVLMLKQFKKYYLIKICSNREIDITSDSIEYPLGENLLPALVFHF